MTKQLVILGAGGHGKVVADCALATKQFDSVMFLDSRYPDVEEVMGQAVIGDTEDLARHISDDKHFFVAVGHNQARQRLTEALLQLNANLATLIHPSAVVSDFSEIGIGTLVCANAVINPATQIGKGCIINTSASVDHDCIIGDYVHIAPGTRLAGTVTVGDRTFIGIGSAVIPNVSIGEDCIVGAGSTLLNDLSAQTTAVGTPARKIKTS